MRQEFFLNNEKHETTRKNCMGAVLTFPFSLHPAPCTLFELNIPGKTLY